MKDLITTIAAITVMMVFIMQFSANQVVMNRILAADSLTENYYTAAVVSGEKNEAIKNGFINKLAAVLGCDQEQIKVYEGENYCKVTAPIENIVACSGFLGIPDEKNKVMYSLTKGKS